MFLSNVSTLANFFLKLTSMYNNNFVAFLFLLTLSVAYGFYIITSGDDNFVRGRRGFSVCVCVGLCHSVCTLPKQLEVLPCTKAVRRSVETVDL